MKRNSVVGDHEGLKRQAAELGAVYRRLFDNRQLPLDDWAVVPSSGNLSSQLLLGISGVYGEAWGPYMDRYRAAYSAVVRGLEKSGNTNAQRILKAEIDKLAELANRIRAAGIAGRLHEAAQRIGRRAGGYESRREDVDAAVDEKGTPSADWMASRQYEFKQSVDANQRKRVAAAVLAEIDDSNNENEPLDAREMVAADNRKLIRELVVVLFTHPKGVQILAAYERSPMTGEELAIELVAEAAADCRTFAGELKDNPKDFWSYSPLVVMGVQELGLSEIDGVAEYAVDLGQVLGRSIAETIIGNLGMVLFCVGLVFTGPVGAAVLGVADLALTGAAGALTYLRERQLEAAAGSFDFKPADQQLAKSGGYGETALTGAAAFISAIGLLGRTKDLLRAQPRVPGVLGEPKTKIALDLRERAGGVSSGSRIEKAIERSGANKMLTSRQIAATGRATNARNAIRQSGATELSPQKLSSNKKRVTASELERLGPGAPRELAPEAFDEVRGTASRLSPDSEPAGWDPLDFNAVPESAVPDAISGVPPPRARSAALDEAEIVARNDEFVAHVDLSQKDRANKPGKQSRRVITLEEQLYGINLEWNEIIRKGTPSDELKAWARAQLPVGASDPLFPSLIVDITTADHIVAVELIKQFPGFAQLDVATQLRILNTPENIMAVSARVNSARGSIPFKEWGEFDGNVMPASIRARMIETETGLAALLQRRIDDALRQQMQSRGVLRASPGRIEGRRIPIGTGQLVRTVPLDVGDHSENDR